MVPLPTFPDIHVSAGQGAVVVDIGRDHGHPVGIGADTRFQQEINLGAHPAPTGADSDRAYVLQNPVQRRIRIRNHRNSIHNARGLYAHESPKATHPTEWIEAPRWEGRLTVTDYAGGRSSSCYVVEIATAKGPPVVGLMSCLTFLPLIPKLVNGGVIGVFTARKQGQNYLIREV